jgi:hypothetical protein
VLFNEAVHGQRMWADEAPGLIHKMCGGGSDSMRTWTACRRTLALYDGTPNSGVRTRCEVNCMACIAAEVR